MVTVCVTYDFDAVSAWLANDMPGFASWGVFGAETATPRLLDLHDRLDIPSTWFVPGHTAESFPEITAEVHTRGHELAHHGWSHVAPAAMDSREAERRDFERGIEALEAVTGERPRGYRAPDGGFSEHTVSLLEELDFEWDSSQGIRDLRPYYRRDVPEPILDEPYDPGRETDIVEVPTAWHRDDWLQIFPVVSGPKWVAYADDQSVIDRWRAELDWVREHVPDAVYVLLLHPQCAGRPPFLAAFEPFLEHADEAEDVSFGTVGAVAEAFRES